MSVYEKYRKAGNLHLALKWRDIVWEMTQAIGEDDAKLFLDDIKDLIEHPFFEKDPVPYETMSDIVERRMKNKNPNLIGHTWASPHSEAWHKLGYYNIFRSDGSVETVFGAHKVRDALLENQLASIKIK